ncbi:helix-turn-helix transcriptional regulator [Crossiella sp. CA-258035]|uniref:helix-turn-helix domain-containing protein n=1 Tax=Crossiella sp. CA-258035 TaxID=2981138 RepID=UPI0024BCB4A8|nr:helix-turn-helix transcriptional regulator [Crossiella sp. CA-258035]WHT16564.1 helix-turn-helix transcriptional regulator [Crossiella sp. CA-258035]
MLEEWVESARALRLRLVEGGRWAEADRVVAEALGQAVGVPSTTGPALAGLSYVAGGPRPGAARCPDRPDPVPPERDLAMRAILLTNRGVDRAGSVELAERVLDSAAWTEAGCFWYSVLALAYAGELTAAQAHCARAAATEGWARSARQRDALTLLRARLATWAGQPRQAVEELESLLARGVYPQFAGLGVAWLAAALVDLGELDRARDLFREHDLDGALDTAPDRAELLAARGALHRAEGQFLLGYQDFLACGRELDGWAVANPAVLPWRSQAALCAHALQRGPLAASLARAELVAARRWGAPRPIGRALHAAGWDSAAQLTEAAALVHGAELVQVRHDLGLLLAARGQQLAAEEAFAAAREAAALVGNTRWAARAAPPPLTSQEGRIAALVRAGLSNKEIAARLGVVVRTVELHLSQVYRKLGVSGRSGLIRG